MFVPSKITFEQLREKAVVGLESLFDKHQKDAKKSVPREGEVRSQELTLFDLQNPKAEQFRDTLEQVALRATTQSQRERYAITEGAKAWHEDHVFLTREVFWQKIGRRSGFELVKEVWGRLSSSRFGRFQRAFCYEYSAVVPRRVVEDSAKEWSREEKAAWKEHLNALSLSGAQVSPDLIPNRLAVRLGLLEWREGTPPWAAVELKNSPAVIDGLKVIFESSMPLVGNNTRIWRLREPGVQSKLRYPDAKIPESWMAGTFIYFRGDDATQPRPREQGRTGFSFRREIPSYFDSVYALYRATLHKSVQYEQEVVALSSLAQSAEDLNLRLANDWRKGASVELKKEMKGELEKLLSRATPVLVGMRHIAKREAGDLLHAMQEAVAEMPKSPDAVVRNMWAVLSRIVALRNRLHERGIDIPRKSRWNTEDQLQLREYITKQEQVFKDLHESLLRSGAIVQQHQSFFDRSKPMSAEDIIAEAKTILQSLNLRCERLAPVTARPLVTFAKAITVVIGELEDSVSKRNRPGTETALIKLMVLTKLEQANACVERLKRFTTYCDVTFDSFEKASADLLEALAKRELFPARGVPDYQKVYAPIQRTFTGLVKRFSELKVGSITDDERIVKYGKIRQFLDDPARDLEHVVAQLVGLELGRRAMEEDTDLGE